MEDLPPDGSLPLAPTVAAAPIGPPVTVRRGLFVFGSYVAAQMAVGLLVGIGVVVAFLRGGGNPADQASLRERVQAVSGVMTVLGIAAGGLTLTGLALRRDRRADPRVRDAIGLRSGARRIVASAAVTGAALALGFVTLSAVLWPPDASFTPGPMGKLALSSGLQHEAWSFAALVLAPPFEELLFRGILLAAFATAWGLAAGAVASTLLFVGMHYPDVSTYPPAALSLALLSGLAIFVRMRSGSIVPSIATHFGYNLALVVLVATGHWR